MVNCTPVTDNIMRVRLCDSRFVYDVRHHGLYGVGPVLVEHGLDLWAMSWQHTPSKQVRRAYRTCTAYHTCTWSSKWIYKTKTHVVCWWYLYSVTHYCGEWWWTSPFTIGVMLGRGGGCAREGWWPCGAC